MSTNSQLVHEVCIALGSNIEPQLNIPEAIDRLSKYVKIMGVSKIWESAAVGDKGPDFLNAAILVHTGLDAESLKQEVLLRIEAQLKRVRTANKNAPRTIDLDIVTYNKQILDDELWTRAHVALPVSELLPDLHHPQTGEALTLVAQRLAKSTPIREREGVVIQIQPGKT
jgi:2-amino-4-hydroxy-6-hydroxymethyldihydropteridine diphosphokinase